MVDFGLYITYFLMLVAVAGAVIFPLKYTLQNISEARGVFIGLGVMLAVLLLGYLTASSTYSFKGMENYISQDSVKLVGGGINSLYILIAVAVVSSIFFEIKNFFK